MANISLRSPQYKNLVAPSNANSVRCQLLTGGNVVYTLIKNNPATNENVQFEVAELMRDYINAGYSTNLSPPNVQFTTQIRAYTGLNGTGSSVASVNFSDVGFESYGKFEEGANPIILPTATKQYFIAPVPNGVDASLTNPRFKIFLPYNIATTVYYQSTTGSIVQSVVSPTATVIGNVGGNPVVLVIDRIDCTKYGNGVKIIFINKYGALQDLWFFLKQTKSLNRTNEKYQSNTIQYPDDEYAQYEINNAPNINANGR